MVKVEALVNGVRVFEEDWAVGEYGAGHYTAHGFPRQLRSTVAAALYRAFEQGVTGELRILVGGSPRYEHPYRNPADGALRWQNGTESSAALRRVIRGLRNPGEAPPASSNGRRTFDHELAARLYAVLPDYAAVGRALQVSGDAVRQAIRRNVEALDD